MDSTLLPQHYWRASKDTKVIYSYCGGTTNTDRCSGNLSRFLTSPDAYCSDGCSDPLCKVCANEQQFLSHCVGTCIDCGSQTLIMKAAFVISFYHILYSSLQHEFWFRSFKASLQVDFRPKSKFWCPFVKLQLPLKKSYGMRLNERIACIWSFEIILEHCSSRFLFYSRRMFGIQIKSDPSHYTFANFIFSSGRYIFLRDCFTEIFSKNLRNFDSIIMETDSVLCS